MEILQIYWKNKPLKYLITENGDVYSLQNKHLFKKMTPEIDKDGYLRIRIKIKKGKSKKFFVHRLVAMMFCDGYNEALVVNHKDGNKRNNHYTNLEWVTLKENEKHASRLFLKANGERNTMCKYSDEMVNQICKMLNCGYKESYIAKKFGLSWYYIHSIKKRIIRKEISRKYIFPYLSSTTIPKGSRIK